jgi:hypothetical protein
MQFSWLEWAWFDRLSSNTAPFREQTYVDEAGGFIITNDQGASASAQKY